MNPLDFLEDKNNKLSIGRDNPTPLYHLLYSTMKEKILNGEFDDGAQMPTEHQLSSAFEVSRITAKRALDELAEEGLVERRRGKGTYVTHKYVPKPVSAPLTGMLESLEIMARDTQVKLIDFKRCAPKQDFEQAFALEAEEDVAYALRIRSSDKTPFAHLASWTRVANKNYNAKLLRSQSRLKLFQKCGIKVDVVKQTISATLCTIGMAKLLDYDEGKPLITLTRYSYSPQGNLIDVLEAHYRPDQFQYQMTLSGNQRKPAKSK